MYVVQQTSIYVLLETAGVLQVSGEPLLGRSRMRLAALFGDLRSGRVIYGLGYISNTRRSRVACFRTMVCREHSKVVESTIDYMLQQPLQVSTRLLLNSGTYRAHTVNLNSPRLLQPLLSFASRSFRASWSFCVVRGTSIIMGETKMRKPPPISSLGHLSVKSRTQNKSTSLEGRFVD